MSTLINLKIGRHTYDITEEDQFMDNGNCVQLLTQSKERFDWGTQPNPCLSKRAVKEIAALNRISLEHNYGDRVQIFKLSKERKV